jgi:apolipoprotein N-acyltransferase
MASVFNVDRHIAFQAGWIAGPAFGVAMMAAPNYLKLEPPFSGLFFWGGIAVFLLTIVVVLVLSFHEKGKRKAVFGPILVMALGALIFCGGAAWYFWPSPKTEALVAATSNDVSQTAENARRSTLLDSPQFSELRNLGQVIGGKDEVGLRNLFDFYG